MGQTVGHKKRTTSTNFSWLQRRVNMILFCGTTFQEHVLRLHSGICSTASLYVCWLRGRISRFLRGRTPGTGLGLSAVNGTRPETGVWPGQCAHWLEHRLHAEGSHVWFPLKGMGVGFRFDPLWVQEATNHGCLSLTGMFFSFPMHPSLPLSLWKIN